MKPSLGSLALTILLWPLALSAEEKLRFNRDIRPILSDKCFHCHGPDSKKREGDLRLDVREEAVKADAITPGKWADSEIIARILSDDPKEHMPPRKSKLGDLTPAELETLKRWIEQGAEYEVHWAFIPPQVLPPPGVGSVIDAWVGAGLAKRGLKILPSADRTTLARRVSFDLTGLPPTPQQIKGFLEDPAPNAYERYVDSLLASPHYGERMAVDWLDVSRYADSYGFQVDRPRDVWPWRDWVVRSFNENQRFDEFITWQLAGDLLPEPSNDQMLATAFNRLHQQESEGGSVEEEYRVEYVCDRVQTFATAFLGLTFECARCHDHKYDPISQKEYFQFFSMFQNIDEAGLYSYFTQSVPTPAFPLMDAALKKKVDAQRQSVETETGKLAELRKAKEAGFEAWLQSRPAVLSVPGEQGRFDFEALEKDALANALDPKKPGKLSGQNKVVPGRSGNALEFTGDDPVTLPVGDFNRHDPMSVSLWMKTPDVKERAVVFHRSKAWTDAASRGYELLIEEGKLTWSQIHFWPGNAISIRSQQPLPVNEWVHVTVTSDGSSRAAGLRLFVNGQPAPVTVFKDNLTKEITYGEVLPLVLGERMRDRGFKRGLVDDLRVFGRELTALEARGVWDEKSAQVFLEKNADTLTGPEREALFEYYLGAVEPEWGQQLAALKTARQALGKLVEPVVEIMTMRELPEPKKAYVLFRGEYNHRREEVQAGTPKVLSPFPAGAPNNRLGLAKWLTAPEHPLTARVLVNRFWQGIFGRGLVKTSEDFGSQGARPLYPEVLDALAVEFVRSGWDTKALIKTIVLSATYRQQSIADPKTMADDPENEWLARGPRFRLSAEMIRDNALAAAGLLAPQLGGRPVNPYDMKEAFKPVNPGAGDAVYRRSLYTNWRRTGPSPAMIAFDAARRAVCSAKRERTDSPLQALILLNGVQFVESARVLGEKLHADTQANLDAMIEQGFLRCLSRTPDDVERSILRQLYGEQLAYFQGHPGEARELLKVGQFKRNPKIPDPEAAAATVLVQALLNHDACVVKL
jgi:hypothetical protein